MRHRAAVAGVSIAAVFAIIGVPHVPRLVWNASESAPTGLYLLRPFNRLNRGDLVLARTPGSVRWLAAARGYVPANVPLAKYVEGVTGDRVCSTGKTISINGQNRAERLQADSRKRPLWGWSGCRTLSGTEVFLLNERSTNSFDGRYFGPVQRSYVIGRLYPLWTR